MKRNRNIWIGVLLTLLFTVIGITIYFSYTEAQKNYKEITKTKEIEKTNNEKEKLSSISDIDFSSLYYSLTIISSNEVKINENRLKYEIVRGIVLRFPNKIKKLDLSVTDKNKNYVISIEVIWNDGRKEHITKLFKKFFNIK